MLTDISKARVGLFTVPSSSGLSLWRLDGINMFELAPVSDDRTALASLSADGSFIAVVDDDRRRLRVWNVGDDGRLVVARGQSLPLLEGGRAHAVLVVGDTVFVGGHTETGESLWFAKAGASRWGNVGFGDTQRWPRKAIDALVCEGDRLVAVDDLVLPKYLFTFDVSTPHRPSLTGEVLMSGPVTWETILGATLDHGRLAILSNGYSREGGSTAICLHRWDALETVEAEWFWPSWGRGSRSPMTRASQLCLVGDRLFAACEGPGVAVADLTHVQPRRRRDGQAPKGPSFIWQDVPGACRVRALVRPLGVADRLVLVGESDEGHPQFTVLAVG